MNSSAGFAPACSSIATRSAFFAFFAASSASVSFAGGMPPLSRIALTSSTLFSWTADSRASSLPEAPFAINSFAISVCAGFFFCAGLTASISGVKP